MNVVGVKHFLKNIHKLKKTKKIARQKITTAIDSELANGMTKVKLALREKVNSLPCYEMRLNLGKLGSVRIAFTLHHEQATVYFLTTDLQKSTFSQEVAKRLG